MKSTITFRSLRRKITLRFDDKEELMTALQGQDWKDLVWEFSNYLREQWKYHDNDAAYDIHQELIKMLNDSNLNVE